MRIEFVIDELVLVGFDPRDRHRIADALESHLAAEAQGVPPERLTAWSRSARTSLRAADVRLPASSGRVDAKAVGEGVSRSVVNAVVGAPSVGRR